MGLLGEMQKQVSQIYQIASKNCEKTQKKLKIPENLEGGMEKTSKSRKMDRIFIKNQTKSEKKCTEFRKIEGFSKISISLGEISKAILLGESNFGISPRKFFPDFTVPLKNRLKIINFRQHSPKK